MLCVVCMLWWQFIKQFTPLRGFMCSRKLWVLPWKREFCWLSCGGVQGIIGVSQPPSPELHLSDSGKCKRARVRWLPAVEAEGPPASPAPCSLALGPNTVCGHGEQLSLYLWRHPSGSRQHPVLHPERQHLAEGTWVSSLGVWKVTPLRSSRGNWCPE